MSDKPEWQRQVMQRPVSLDPPNDLNARCCYCSAVNPIEAERCCACMQRSWRRP